MDELSIDYNNLNENENVEKVKITKDEETTSSDPSSQVGRLLCEAKTYEEENEILNKFKLKLGTVGSDFAVMMALFISMKGNEWKHNIGWNGESSDWYGVKLNKKYRVVEIDIHNNNLNGNIPRCIHLLSKLKILNLSHNINLSGIIPNTLAQLKHLSSLNMRNTSLIMPITNLPIYSYGLDSHRENQKHVETFQNTLLYMKTKPIILKNASKLNIEWNQCEVNKLSPSMKQSNDIHKGWILNKIDGIKLSDMQQSQQQSPSSDNKKTHNVTNRSFYSSLIQNRFKNGPKIMNEYIHLRHKKSENEDYHEEVNENENDGFTKEEDIYGDHTFLENDCICLEFVAPNPWFFEGRKPIMTTKDENNDDNSNVKLFPFSPLLGYQLELIYSNSNKNHDILLSQYVTDVTRIFYEYDLNKYEQYRVDSDLETRKVSMTRKIHRAKYGVLYSHRITGEEDDGNNLKKKTLLLNQDDKCAEETKTKVVAEVEEEDIYEFDFITEPLLPTKSIGIQGGLIGCEDQANLSFGATMLAPPGALSQGVELSLSKGNPEIGKRRKTSDDNDDEEEEVIYDSMVSIDVNGVNKEGDDCLKLPVSMKLQHAFVLDSLTTTTSGGGGEVERKQDKECDDQQQLYVVSRYGKDNKWIKVENANISDKYAIVILEPGLIPSHIAIQSKNVLLGKSNDCNHQEGSGDGSVMSYQNTMMATVIVCAKRPISNQTPSLSSSSSSSSFSAIQSKGQLNISKDSFLDDGLVTIWVIPDRDDTRQAVAQRMKKRSLGSASSSLESQNTHQNGFEWKVISESIEDFIVSKNNSVSINIDNGFIREERIFKPEKGACFHALIQNKIHTSTTMQSKESISGRQNGSPYAKLTVIGHNGEGVDLYIPRPLYQVGSLVQNRIPLKPELIYREDGGSLTIKIANKKLNQINREEKEDQDEEEEEEEEEEVASMIVQVYKLQVRDCADISGQLIMPEIPPTTTAVQDTDVLIPPNSWETVYEGAMTVCVVDGGFACFVRSRYAEGGPWSQVLIVPPPGAITTPPIQADITTSSSSSINKGFEMDYNALTIIVSKCHQLSSSVKDPNKNNCQLLSHRIACALASLGKIPRILFNNQENENIEDENNSENNNNNNKLVSNLNEKKTKIFSHFKRTFELYSELLTKFQEAESLIQASLCEGWLSRILWPPMNRSHVFINLDEIIFNIILKIYKHYELIYGVIYINNTVGNIIGNNNSTNDKENVRDVSLKTVKEASMKPGGTWYENTVENTSYQMLRQQLCFVLLRSSPPPLNNFNENNNKLNGQEKKKDNSNDENSVVEGQGLDVGDDVDEGKDVVSMLYAKSLSLDMGFSPDTITSEEVTSIRFHEAYHRLIHSASPFPLHKLSSSTSTSSSLSNILNTSQDDDDDEDFSLSHSSLTLLSNNTIHNHEEMPSIFISYAKEDGEKVLKFVNQFVNMIIKFNIGIPILSLQNNVNHQTRSSHKVNHLDLSSSSLTSSSFKDNKNNTSKNSHSNHSNNSNMVTLITDMVRKCDIFFAILSPSYGRKTSSPCSHFELIIADQVLLPIIPISFSMKSQSGPLFGFPTVNFQFEIDCYLKDNHNNDNDNDDDTYHLNQEKKLEQLCQWMKAGVTDLSTDLCLKKSNDEGNVNINDVNNHHKEEEENQNLVEQKKPNVDKTIKDKTNEDKKESQEEETLESWLSSLRLLHILPILQTLGAEVLSDIEFLDDEDIKVLALRSIERKKFDRAKKKLLIKLGCMNDNEEEGGDKEMRISKEDSSQGLSVDSRPKVAKRIDMALKSDPIDEKVWRAEVFGSMRFDASGAARRGGEAEQLKKALEDQGVKLHVVDISAGASITLTVFDIMERCHGFIAFGTKTYGANTGNPAATDREVAYWQGVIQQSTQQSTQSSSDGQSSSIQLTAQAMAEARPLIPIRMIDFNERFNELTARVLFGCNALSIQWTLGNPMPTDVVPQILRALRLSHLSPPVKELEYRDPSSSKFDNMLDELEKSSVPISKCLVYWYGSLQQASQALRSGIHATFKSDYITSNDNNNSNDNSGDNDNNSSNDESSGVYFTLHRPNELDHYDKLFFKESREVVLICSVPCMCLKKPINVNDDDDGIRRCAVRYISSQLLTSLQGMDYSSLVDPQPWHLNHILLTPNVILFAIKIEKIINSSSLLSSTSTTVVADSTSSSTSKPQPLSTSVLDDNGDDSTDIWNIPPTTRPVISTMNEKIIKSNHAHLKLIKPANISELIDIINNIKKDMKNTAVGNENLSCMYQYTNISDFPFIIRDGIKQRQNHQSNHQILFTTKSPLSIGIGTENYYKNIQSIYEDDDSDSDNISRGDVVDPFYNKGNEYKLIVIYACDSDILVPIIPITNQINNETTKNDNISHLFSINNNYIHSLALLNRDGIFYLNKNRILALIEIDPLSLGTSSSFKDVIGCKDRSKVTWINDNVTKVKAEEMETSMRIHQIYRESELNQSVVKSIRTKSSP